LGEWFKPAVLKTADVKASVSSNLTLSAKNACKPLICKSFLAYHPSAGKATIKSRSDFSLRLFLWRMAFRCVQHYCFCRRLAKLFAHPPAVAGGYDLVVKMLFSLAEARF
jgi:hypothetical protein